jgi:Arc/MetJ family transcription regulator
MVSSMKTTIDITDGLLAEAKQVAARKHTTVRALVEDGLRLVLDREKDEKPFKLRDGCVGGSGLRPEMRDASHEEWLDAVYGDRA